jgi:hypothetical protein
MGNQLGQLAGCLKPLPQRFVRRHPALQLFDLLHRNPRRFGIGPEARLGLLLLQNGEAIGFSSQVKESLGVR